MHRKLNLVAILLACVGIFVAGTLTRAHLLGVDVPCRLSGIGCQAVQNHPSSEWFGIPVAIFGLGAYIALLALAAFRIARPENAFAPRAALAISAVGAVVSIALQIYAAVVIRASCDWCIASAIAMACLAIVNAMLWQRFEPGENAKSAGKTDWAIAGVLLAATMVGMFASFGMASQGSGTVIETPGGSKDTLLVGAPSLGPEDAPITIVEFADLLCGSCRESFTMMKKLQAEHPGKIRWVFRHFPLWNVEGHEQALPGAIVAEHAAKQGKFWEFVEQFYNTDPKAMKTLDDVLMIAHNVNVDVSKVQAAIDSEESPEMLRVTADINLAHKIGVAETPTFVLFVEGQRPIALRKLQLQSKLNSVELRSILNK